MEGQEVLANKMKLIRDEGHVKLYEYKPTLIKPLAINFEKMRFIRRLRFLYEYMHKGHYSVYYLMIDDSFVGHCVITPGGRRLWLSGKDDIVIGPYFIDESYRGHGYAQVLLALTLKYCPYNYRRAYDWIEESNVASIKTSEACGMRQEGSRLNVVGLTRKLVEANDGEDIVYVYDNPNYTK